MCPSSTCLNDRFGDVAHALYDKAYAFALYRLPHQTNPVCVIDLQERPSWIKTPSELTQQSGFVLAPFAFPTKPARFIKADHVFFNPSEALSFIDTLPHRSRPKAKVNVSTNESQAFENYAQTFGRFYVGLDHGTLSKTRAFAIKLDDVTQTFDTRDALSPCLHDPSQRCSDTHVDL